MKMKAIISLLVSVIAVHAVEGRYISFQETKNCLTSNGNRDCVDKVRRFISHHQINEFDLQGRSMLHYAAELGNIAETQILLNNGADVNLLELYTRMSPLHKAVVHGGLETVNKLLDARGININLQDRYGDSPLHIAASRGNLEDINKLVNARGININIQNIAGHSPLHRAVKKGEIEAVDKLLHARGININLQTTQGYSSLYEAAKKGNLELVTKLVDAGANISLQDNWGYTAYDKTRVWEIMMKIKRTAISRGISYCNYARC